MKTKHIAEIGMFLALAFIFSYVESLIPVSLAVPGIKLGLSNLVVMVGLYRFSARTTFGIAMIRIVLVGLTFGNLSSMMYGMAGGILSFLVMFFLKKTKKFSVYGVSMAGGVFHNIGQILVACLILQTKILLYYLPFLLVAGVLAGMAVGFASGLVLKHLPCPES